MRCRFSSEVQLHFKNTLYRSLCRLAEQAIIDVFHPQVSNLTFLLQKRQHRSAASIMKTIFLFFNTVLCRKDDTNQGEDNKNNYLITQPLEFSS